MDETVTISFAYSVGSANFSSSIELSHQSWQALQDSVKEETLYSAAMDDIADMLDIDFDSVMIEANNQT